MIESPSATTKGGCRRTRAPQARRCPKPKRLALPRVEVLHARPFEGERFEQSSSRSRAASCTSSPFTSKWFSISTPCRPGDEEQPLHARRSQLLDHVLNDGLATDRQHFLRLRFRRGQQARPEAGDGHDSDIDTHGSDRPWALIIRQPSA
jgi:hypothetical protein